MSTQITANHNVFTRRMSVTAPRRDRRQAPRIAASLGCKVRRASGLRYTPAQTVDLSTNGAAIHVPDATSFVPGESLELIVDWTGSSGIVERTSAVRGIVTRVTAAADSTAGIVAATLVRAAEPTANTTWKLRVAMLWSEPFAEAA